MTYSLPNTSAQIATRAFILFFARILQAKVIKKENREMTPPSTSALQQILSLIERRGTQTTQAYVWISSLKGRNASRSNQTPQKPVYSSTCDERFLRDFASRRSP